MKPTITGYDRVRTLLGYCWGLPADRVAAGSGDPAELPPTEQVLDAFRSKVAGMLSPESLDRLGKDLQPEADEYAEAHNATLRAYTETEVPLTEVEERLMRWNRVKAGLREEIGRRRRADPDSWNVGSSVTSAIHRVLDRYLSGVKAEEYPKAFGSATDFLSLLLQTYERLIREAKVDAPNDDIFDAVGRELFRDLDPTEAEVVERFASGQSVEQIVSATGLLEPEVLNIIGGQYDLVASGLSRDQSP